MDGKILVLSPNLDLHGGNLITLSRIRDHLVSHKYKCELSSPMAFSKQETFLQKVKAENIQMLIGIHAYKTGVFMKESTLPFILIIGGTDANVMAEDATKLKEMSEVVMKASFVVCFSSELKVKVKRLWPEIDNSQLKVIPQGIEIHLSEKKIDGGIIKKCLCDTYNTNNNDSLPVAFQDGGTKPIIFTLIAGIRPVKNPLYLVSTFQEWHAKDDRIFFLVVGQVLDASYAENQFLPEVNRKPGVLFVPGVSISEAHSIVKESFALVNSSDNEGMCLAILEAMVLEVPVLARDNLGNRSIVDDGHTGLIFTSPQTFISKAQWLIDHPTACSKIVDNAKDFVTTNHSLEAERVGYTNAVKQSFR